MNTEYTFADLSVDAVRELKQLEARLQLELGEDITLIAYAKEDDSHSTACRADAEGD